MLCSIATSTPFFAADLALSYPPANSSIFTSLPLLFSSIFCYPFLLMPQHAILPAKLGIISAKKRIYKKYTQHSQSLYFSHLSWLFAKLFSAFIAKKHITSGHRSHFWKNVLCKRYHDGTICHVTEPIFMGFLILISSLFSFIFGHKSIVFSCIKQDNDRSFSTAK